MHLGNGPCHRKLDWLLCTLKTSVFRESILSRRYRPLKFYIPLTYLFPYYWETYSTGPFFKGNPSSITYARSIATDDTDKGGRGPWYYRGGGGDRTWSLPGHGVDLKENCTSYSEKKDNVRVCLCVCVCLCSLSSLWDSLVLRVISVMTGTIQGRRIPDLRRESQLWRPLLTEGLGWVPVVTGSVGVRTSLNWKNSQRRSNELHHIINEVEIKTNYFTFYSQD